MNTIQDFLTTHRQEIRDLTERHDKERQRTEKRIDAAERRTQAAENHLKQSLAIEIERLRKLHKKSRPEAPKSDDKSTQESEEDELVY